MLFSVHVVRKTGTHKIPGIIDLSYILSIRFLYDMIRRNGLENVGNGVLAPFGGGRVK